MSGTNFFQTISEALRTTASALWANLQSASVSVGRSTTALVDEGKTQKSR
jgi:hypothetical protein